MYAALWRVLPGPVVVKAVLALVLLLAVVYALFTWVFPAVADRLPEEETTVEPAAYVLGVKSWV